MDSDIKLDISFRFFSLSEELANEIKSINEASSCRPNRKLGGFVVCVPLTPSTLEFVASFVTSHNVEVENTDIFVSFATEYDARIITLPNIISKASFSIGSPVTLSYTVV